MLSRSRTAAIFLASHRRMPPHHQTACILVFPRGLSLSWANQTTRSSHFQFQQVHIGRTPFPNLAAHFSLAARPEPMRTGCRTPFSPVPVLIRGRSDKVFCLPLMISRSDCHAPLFPKFQVTSFTPRMLTPKGNAYISSPRERRVKQMVPPNSPCVRASFSHRDSLGSFLSLTIFFANFYPSLSRSPNASPPRAFSPPAILIASLFAALPSIPPQEHLQQVRDLFSSRKVKGALCPRRCKSGHLRKERHLPCLEFPFTLSVACPESHACCEVVYVTFRPSALLSRALSPFY